MNTLSPFAALIGIDWADRKHDICLKPAGAETLEISILEHTPEAINKWANDLRKRFKGKAVAVCLEAKKGPLVYALMKFDFITLFPANPQSVARYRRAFTPSRAKDDPSDAEVLLDLLQRHPDKVRPWQPENPEIRTLTQLLEMRRRVVGDKVRITNRLTAALKNYYPQALELFEDKDTVVFCRFLEKWPSLQLAKRARKSTLLSFFQSHAGVVGSCGMGQCQSPDLTSMVSYGGCHRVRSWVFERLEPCEGKLSCTVLRGGNGRKVIPLPALSISRAVALRSPGSRHIPMKPG